MDSTAPGGPRPRNRILTGRGGPGRGQGRKPGSMSKLAKDARAKAEQTGLLPHEILLSMARGEPAQIVEIDDQGNRKIRYEPLDKEDVRDAAKAAAPYYAPKISTVEVIQGVSDADLDEFIARAAAEAGLGIGPGGEGQED